MIPKPFGEVLHEIRMGVGMSAGELARRMKVSTVFVSRVEKGKSPPLTRERVLEVAGILEVDPARMLEALAVYKGKMEIPLFPEGSVAARYAKVLQRAAADWTEEDFQRALKEAKAEEVRESLPLEIVEVYIDYNEPLLYLARSAAGTLFLCVYADHDDVEQVWLCVIVSSERIGEIRSGSVDLHDAFCASESGEAFLRYHPYDGSPDRVELMVASTLPESRLPNPGCFLEKREWPALNAEAGGSDGPVQ